MALQKSGLKTGLKAVGQAVSRRQFVDVPQLGLPVNYAAWLARLLRIPQNQRTAARCVKSDIDELLHQKTSKQFKNNNELLKKALAEVNATWEEATIATDTCHRLPRKLVRMPGSALKPVRMAWWSDQSLMK
jgi:hypothetical protein